MTTFSFLSLRKRKNQSPHNYFSSIHDVLTESVIEDGPVKYSILEGGSQRRTKVLISSLGYAYGIKVSEHNMVCFA